jgi:hypothetical protein
MTTRETADQFALAAIWKFLVKILLLTSMFYFVNTLSP